jgi:integrase
MAGCVAPEKSEVLAVLEHCLERKKLMKCCYFAFGCGTGGRVSELIDVQRKTLLSNGKIRNTITLNKLKARESALREIPWNHRLDKYVLPWLIEQQEFVGLERPDDYVFSSNKGGHISRGWAWAMMQPVYKRVGITEKVANHGMRKLFGQGVYHYFWKKTGDQINALTITRDALGHSSIEVTIDYLELQKGNVAEALDDVFSFL